MKSYHKHTCSCLKHSFFSALFLSVSQLLAWCALIVLSIFAYKRFAAASFCFSLPCLLLLFSYRFFVTNKLLHLLDPMAPGTKSFPGLICASVYRLFTSMLWLIPLLVVLYRFYQYIFILPATTFTSDFTKIGAFIAADASLATQLLIGTGVFFALLFFTGFIFLYGFSRGNCFDLAQMEGLSFFESLRRSRKMRRATRNKHFLNTVLHALILLPAIIAPCILPMMQLLPLLTGKAMNDIQLIYVYLSAGIVSDGTLILSGCIFLLLYLPWLPFRKLHNIAAVVVRHD